MNVSGRFHWARAHGLSKDEARAVSDGHNCSVCFVHFLPTPKVPIYAQEMCPDCRRLDHFVSSLLRLLENH